MQAKELRNLSAAELDAKEHELHDDLFRLRMRRATNQLDRPAALRAARRSLARLYTVRGEKQRASTTSE